MKTLTASNLLLKCLLGLAVITGQLSMAAPQNGLVAKYFTDLSLAQFLLTRIESTINLNTANGVPTGINPDIFSASWTGFLKVPVSGIYTLCINADDGVRLSVDNKLIIDAWVRQLRELCSPAISLSADNPVAIQLKYFNQYGGGLAQLNWVNPAGVKQLVPSSALWTEMPQAAPNGLNAEYFSGITLLNRVSFRIDPQVSLTQTSQLPLGLNASEFSIRWSGAVVSRYTESYQICVGADDGIRLWVNGTLAINRWVRQFGEFCGTVPLVAGVATPIVLEYFNQWGGFKAELFWQSSHQSKELIPQSQLIALGSAPAPAPAPTQTSNGKTYYGVSVVPSSSDMSFAGYGLISGYGTYPCGGLPLSGDGVLPKLICPGMALPNQPVFLNRNLLTERIGTSIRTRPYSSSGNQQELLAQHNGIGKNLQIRGHDVVNGPALMFNASDTGTVVSAIGTYATLRYYEAGWLEFYNIYKTVGSSAHTDCLWVDGSRDYSANPIATHIYLHDIFCHNTASSTASMLVEGGRWGIFLMKNIAYRDLMGQRNIEVKAPTKGNILFVENYDGPDFTFFYDASTGARFDAIVFKKARYNLDSSRRPKVNYCLSGGSCAGTYPGRIIYDDNFPTPTFDSNGNYTNKADVDTYLKKYP